ncbi:flavodoxin domain-containing protein [Candidatus Micrarchaeota archaeon]|nr:flavodoxin domain-containing protein [Candidatus Micrarchaeota archaeon]
MALGGVLVKSRSEVFYSTKSGNTQKIAEAIAECMGTQALNVSGVGEGHSLSKCDLLFVGSGSYGSAPSAEMAAFIRGLGNSEGRHAAVFGTSGGGREDYLKKMKALLEGRGLKVIGMWGCLGQEYSLKNKGKPDDKDLKDAAGFAKKMLMKIEII